MPVWNLFLQRLPLFLQATGCGDFLTDIGKCSSSWWNYAVHITRPRGLKRKSDNLQLSTAGLWKQLLLIKCSGCKPLASSNLGRHLCQGSDKRRWVLRGSESVVLTGITSPIWAKKSMEKWSFLSYFYFVFVKFSFGKIKHLDLFMEIVVIVIRKKIIFFS
jgi:hypothetical protein